MRKHNNKPVNHKVLQEQSQKLKQKLQMLKQQIQTKKRQKALSKNSIALLDNLTQQAANSRLSLNGKEQFKSLQSLLVEMKMGQLLAKFNQKNIISIKDFRSLSSAQVDKWRDVPVGYRIKIKKNLQQLQKSTTNNQLSHSKTQQCTQQSSPLKNIEQIMHKRQQSKKYVSLNRLTQEDEIAVQSELNEADQEVMIQSLIEAFQPRYQSLPSHNSLQNSTLKQQLTQQSKFSPLKYEQVLQYEQPNPTIKSQIDVKKQCLEKDFPEYKYCWNCLKKIEQLTNIQEGIRQFCSDICHSKYRKLEHDKSFYERLQQTQNEFSQFLQARQTGKPYKHTMHAAMLQIDLDIL